MKATQMETRKTGLKKRLRINGAIREWWKVLALIPANILSAIALYFAIIALIGSCATTDVVYVPPGDAVKLRETIEDVKVWIKTTEKIVLPGTTTLYEGWF